MPIDCLVLGAGQEVGKSCVVVSINGKRIMFDCGLHMGYNDHRQFPDFSLISKSGNFNEAISCIIITHCHLDHVGALPYFTEVCGYHGPIYMTYPTKALSPLMLEDNRMMVERRGNQEQFTSEHIVECFKKVIAVDVKQTVKVDKDLQIRAYYAGHVLGAAMFYAKVGGTAILYTGDYNMTPDKHLGAAQIDQLQLDLVITESTYGTTVRESKYVREREFLKAVHKCVASSGKVLIPTFALGRAQELCILLDDYWQRINLNVPIYFSAGCMLLFVIGWTSQKVKGSYAVRNAFDFKNVNRFDRSLINASGPCVLFATPGMIVGGFSLEVFKQWAPSENNLVTLPGYCVPGTVGHKLMSGKSTKIDLDKDTQIDVRCQVHQLSFSAHTDSKGIMDLLKFLSPKHVILVHGEKPKMASLKKRIESELRIQCYYPANNETIRIPSTHHLVSTLLSETIATKTLLTPNFKFPKSNHAGSNGSQPMCPLRVRDERLAEGILLREGSKMKGKIVHESEVLQFLGEERNDVRFAYCFPANVGIDLVNNMENCHRIRLLFEKLSREAGSVDIHNFGEYLQAESFCVCVCGKEKCAYRRAQSGSETLFLCCVWSVADEKLAWKLIGIMEGG